MTSSFSHLVHWHRIPEFLAPQSETTKKKQNPITFLSLSLSSDSLQSLNTTNRLYLFSNPRPQFLYSLPYPYTTIFIPLRPKRVLALGHKLEVRVGLRRTRMSEIDLLYFIYCLMHYIALCIENWNWNWVRGGISGRSKVL